MLRIAWVIVYSFAFLSALTASAIFVETFVVPLVSTSRVYAFTALLTLVLAATGLLWPRKINLALLSLSLVIIIANAFGSSIFANLSFSQKMAGVTTFVIATSGWGTLRRSNVLLAAFFTLTTAHLALSYPLLKSVLTSDRWAFAQIWFVFYHALALAAVFAIFSLS